MTLKSVHQEKDYMKLSIGEIVAGDFRTAKVFDKFAMDFCCGGGTLLSDACKALKIDPSFIIKELSAAELQPVDRGHDFVSWELPFLIDYIINVHHHYLKNETGIIKTYVDKIANVHGTKHIELEEISRLFNKIAGDMAEHLKTEEEVLFPLVRRIYSTDKTGIKPDADDVKKLASSLDSLKVDHTEIGDAIHKIRHLSKNYYVPNDACNAYVIAYTKLKEFEDDLHKHVHLENNILFPGSAAL